ncbi:class I SAM-dependent methyltransferase [Streptomyces sp. NPDC055103]
MDELRAYLHSIGRSFTPMRDSSRELAESWKRQADTQGSRAEFFRSSEAYLYNLAIWHASGHRPPYLAAAGALLASRPGATVADVGCGIGSDTLTLAGMGHPVVPIDYDSPSTHFARWRLRRAGLDDTVYQPDALPAALAPQVVWIVDTLDHIPDLESQLAPLLGQCQLVISEAQQPFRAHGDNRYYIRRTPCELDSFFAAYGLTPTPTSPIQGLLSVWEACRVRR